MASPFLAQLALGYAQQTNANQAKESDRLREEAAARKKMDVELEYQSKLQDLAFEKLHRQQQETVGRQVQEAELRRRFYQTTADTSTDPREKALAQKRADLYTNAGGVDSAIIEQYAAAVSPTKPEKLSVAEQEFKRKLRNEETLSTNFAKVNEMIQDPNTFTQLEKDPKAKASLLLSLKASVDKDYHKDIDDTFNAFFPHPDEKKLPEIFKTTAADYRKKTSQYLTLSTGKKAVHPEELQSLQQEINMMADGLNQLALNMGSTMRYAFFEDTDNDPTTPAVAISPEKKDLLEQTRYVGGAVGAKQVEAPPPAAPQPIPYRERKAQLSQTPGATPQQIATQLTKEIAEGKVSKP
jgi:hypothetical protein